MKKAVVLFSLLTFSGPVYSQTIEDDLPIFEKKKSFKQAYDFLGEDSTVDLYQKYIPEISSKKITKEGLEFMDDFMEAWKRIYRIHSNFFNSEKIDDPYSKGPFNYFSTALYNAEKFYWPLAEEKLNEKNPLKEPLRFHSFLKEKIDSAEVVANLQEEKKKDVDSFANTETKEKVDNPKKEKVDNPKKDKKKHQILYFLRFFRYK